MWIVIIIVLASLVFLEVIRELHCFQVTEYTVESEKLKNDGKEQRVIFLSDLHNHVYGKENEKLRKAIVDAKPDLILIGGDMLVGKKGRDYGPALKFVKSLTSICPVYYANGNHEQRMKEKPEEYDFLYKEYKKSLQKEGVCFLENQTVKVKNVKITGLEIPLTGYRRLREGYVEEAEIVRRIGEKEGEEFQILLAHNPCYMELYKKWGADLILSGHLHGGVARIPGVLGVITPAFQLFPKYSGDIYREDGKAIIVSKGLGTHTVNIRFLNPAEVIVIHLKDTAHIENSKRVSDKRGNLLVQ